MRQSRVTTRRWSIGAAALAAALVLAGCTTHTTTAGSSPSPSGSTQSDPSSPQGDTGTASPEPTATTATARITDFPASLDGLWCTRRIVPTCFDAAQVIAKYPNAFVNTTYGTTTTTYEICTIRDGADGCATADSILIEYWPVGATWDCPAYIASAGTFTGCDPDFTAEHDSTQERLTNPPNHQMNDAFDDSEPMYRVS